MKIKIDMLYIFILLTICIVCFFIFGTNIYSPYSDIGRELYIVEQVKNGDVLYKDIFNVYFPMGYWINAIIIKIFGSSFNTYYGIGTILTILTILPVYLITKLYTNKHIAFTASLFIVVSCAFYPSISNWITPYSYSIMYALCATIWSTYFLVKFIKNKNKIDLYYSSILIGLGITFKYEFILLALFILLISLYKKDFFKTFIAVISIPLIALTILFIQGCTFNDLLQALNYMIGISKSHSAKFFYQFAGITFSLDSFILSIYKSFHPQFRSIFGLICYINLIILVFTLIKKNYLVSLILFIGLITSIKSLGGISFEVYGTYFFPLLFIGLIITIYSKGGKIKTIILSIICLILTSCYFTYGIKEQIKYTKIQTSKGAISIPKVFKKSTIEIINYIEKNIKKDESILILPEGALINFITDNKSDNFLYYLIPPNTDIFDEEFINNKIKEKKIDYIITTNIQYPWYNEKSFMTGWGTKYLNLIQSEYKQYDVIGDNLKFYIFKHDIINKKD